MFAAHGERIVIRRARHGVARPCGVCGTGTVTVPGPGLFIEGTPSPVCPLCGERYAPELARLSNAGRVRPARGGG
jgi:hypothetical protein